MKKILCSIVMIFVMALSLVACKSGELAGKDVLDTGKPDNAVTTGEGRSDPDTLPAADGSDTVKIGEAAGDTDPAKSGDETGKTDSSALDITGSDAESGSEGKNADTGMAGEDSSGTAVDDNGPGDGGASDTGSENNAGESNTAGNDTGKTGETAGGTDPAKAGDDTGKTDSDASDTAGTGAESKVADSIETGTESGSEDSATVEGTAAEDATAAAGNDSGLQDGGTADAEKIVLTWNEDWEYAGFSKIHSSSPALYKSSAMNRKNIVVSVNAGHGTSGGSNVKTLCHPDGSAKVTGGSTAAGATHATAVSYGTTFLDGTPEAKANLSLALILKKILLDKGYDVLMIREDSDVQLDNIARTVFSNNYADCHIALHYDSTETDKGFYFIGVPDVDSYRTMEPVASHWKSHNALGEALLEGVKQAGLKICGNGNIPLDLTQTSYSTVPSVDVEVGDRKSDYSEKTQKAIAAAIADGLDIFFEQ